MTVELQYSPRPDRLSTRPFAPFLIGVLLFTFVVPIAFAPAALAERRAPETQAPCPDRDPMRRVYWGDLHVHTALSMDAWIFQTRSRPADAYRFARGESIRLAPLDENGKGTRPVKINRPLDFAAVTDHANSMGGVRLCTTPGSAVYDSEICVRYRRPFRPGGLKEGAADIVERTTSLASEPLCGPGGGRCRDGLLEAWQETQLAAAKANDRCAFTTFVAYEYTATPKMTKIHRNIIFRGETVPEVPISFDDEPTARGLWNQLDRQCIDAGTGCDVLSIPHNANLSNGQLFTVEKPEGSTRAQQAEWAAQRKRLEPVVEMIQKKGESECRAGLWKVLGADEDCDFEKIRAADPFEDCEDGKGWGALGRTGCVSRLDYARYALIEGLREEERIGVNPYAFGMIGATDIHTGNPGPTEEWETDALMRFPQPGNTTGGLAGVWAEENTREAIFDALRRREVYATSGPRMTVRMFAGWDLPADLCGRANALSTADAQGVPMGSDLPARSGQKTGPRFYVSALRDPGSESHPGGLLQRVQIVKGWAGADGTFHQQVVDAVGNPDNGASVDTDTCTPKGPGSTSLCAVWQDPSFDPAQRAVYYARVLENPSCRASGWMCRPGLENRPRECDDPALPMTTQERAWTSPVWYSPPTQGELNSM